MIIYTRILIALLVASNLFSCARREQAFYQRVQREQFSQCSSLTTTQAKVSSSSTDTSQILIDEAEIALASAHTDMAVGYRKSEIKHHTVSTRPVIKTNSSGVDQNKHPKKTQLHKLIIKKVVSDTPVKTSGLAIAALVCGILSFIVLGIVLGPLAIIFGGIALSKTRRDPEMKGRGLAVAGLVLGIVATVLVVVYLASR